MKLDAKKPENMGKQPVFGEKGKRFTAFSVKIGSRSFFFIPSLFT